MTQRPETMPGQEPFEKLAEDVFVWWGDLATHEQTNVGVIHGVTGSVVIDSNFPWAAERLADTIEANGWSPVTHVVNTHYHVDHSLGNTVFAERGATIVGATGQRTELAAKGQHDAVVQTGQESDLLLGPSMEFRGELRFYEPDVVFRSVEPAHTSSDVIAWLPASRILFVGDLAVNWDHGNNLGDPDGDIDGWIRVLDECVGLDPALVVPAHGARMTAAELRGQRDFIAELWSVVRSAAVVDMDDFLVRHSQFVANRNRYDQMAATLHARHIA